MRSLFISFLIFIFSIGVSNAQNLKEKYDKMHNAFKEHKYEFVLIEAKDFISIMEKSNIKNDKAFAEFYWLIGTCYYMTFEYEKAIEPYQKSLDIYERNLNLYFDDYIDTYEKLFFSLDKSGFYTDAKKLVNKQLSKFGKLRNEVSLNLLLDIEYIHSIEGNITEAGKALINANNLVNSITISDKSRYKLAKANIQYNSLVGDYSEFPKHHMKSIEITKKLYGIGSYQYIREYYNMINAKVNIFGCNEKTVGYIDNLLGLYKDVKINDDYMLSELYSLKTLVQIEIGKLNDAIITINTMRKVLEVSNLPSNILDKKYGDYYFSLGYLYFEKGIYALSEKYLKSSLSKHKNLYNSNSIFIATLKNNIAQALRKQKKLKEASSYFSSSFNIAKNNFDNLFYSTSETEKEIYLNFKIPSLISDINVFATEYKDSNPNIIDDVYNNTLYFKNILLKSSSSMYNTIKNSNNSILIGKYEELIKLRNRLAKLYESNGKDNEIETLENDANSIEKYLVSKSNEFGYFTIDKSINWESIRNNLKNNEVAIEFIDFYNDNTNQTEYYSLILQVKSVHPKMIFLFNEKQLKEVINNNSLNQNSINNLYGANNQSNNSLYKYIWEPIIAEIGAENKLYYSKSGILHSVSFDCIRDNNGTFLIDNYELINTNTTSEIISQTKTDIHSFNRALLFGGIDFNDINISNLQYSKIEVENIKQILEGNNVDAKLISNTNATESKFKELASNNQLIHLATHGYFTQKKPNTKEKRKRVFERIRLINTIYEYNNNPLLNSGLLFSKNQLSDNGRLSAYEVSQLDLINTDLVVLSACSSGLGDIYGTEGVYGLQRSFKMAGAKNLIVSLWEVNDEKTKEFMIDFYKNLFINNNIRKAFQMTQNKMSKKYDPYYWGAFVLIE